MSWQHTAFEKKYEPAEQNNIHTTHCPRSGATSMETLAFPCPFLSAGDLFALQVLEEKNGL